MVATRGHILLLKCTKVDFGWGSATDPSGGVYKAPQTPSWSLLLRKGEGRGRGAGDVRGGEGKNIGTGRGVKGRR